MYEKYKNINLPWLRKIPAHWDIIRGKNLYKKMQRPVNNDDEVITCFRDGIVTLRKNRRLAGFTESIKEFGYQGIKKGDLVIHIMDAFAGSIGVSDSNGKGTPVYNVCQKKLNINNYYYAYLLRETARNGFIQSLYKGIRERSSDFRFDVFGSQFYPIPPRAEQDQIVRFLDWKVSAINRLINLKQKQIIDIYNLKQIEINYKLDISKSKDIEKLRLKNISRIYGRIGFRGYSRNDMVDEGEGAITTSPSNIEEDKVVFDKCSYVSWEKYEESPEIKLGKNDILVVKTGSSYGKTGFIENELSYPATINPQLLIIRGITEKVIPKYLYFVIKYGNIQEQINRNVIGSTIPTISENRISSMYLSLPDKSIQYKVITEVEKIICKYFSLVSSLLKQIETLQQFKTRLIADAVTGKIDVRGVEMEKVVV